MPRLTAGRLDTRPSQAFVLGHVFQLPLDDAVKARCLIGIALDGIGDVLLGITTEMRGLTQHGPETAALKQEPLQRLRALRPAGRKKSPPCAPGWTWA